MRFTRPLTKAAYIIGGYALLVLFTRATHPLAPTVFAVLDFIVFGTYILVGVRSFRGKYEPVLPPRPWWRMTGRPKAGFWLGALLVLGVVSFLLAKYIPVELRVSYIAQELVFGLLYLNSSIQLVRRGTAKREQASSAAFRPAPLPRALR